jgi:hypothetical protein
MDPKLEAAAPMQSVTIELDDVTPEVSQSLASEELVVLELDDATIDLGRQAARPPWYASWVTGAVMVGAPVLTVMAGIFGANDIQPLWFENLK